MRIVLKMAKNSLSAAAGQVQIGNYKINRLGLGTNRISDRPEAYDLLKHAVELGVNFIDTARVYTGGASEAGIGNALAPYANGLVIATKGGMGSVGGGGNSPEFLRANLEESLRHLRTDHIKLYQLHRIDPTVPLSKTMQVLKTFQQEGKIEHIGLSEATVGQIEEARRYAPVVSVQNQYNITN